MEYGGGDGVVIPFRLFNKRCARASCSMGMAPTCCWMARSYGVFCYFVPCFLFSPSLLITPDFGPELYSIFYFFQLFHNDASSSLSCFIVALLIYMELVLMTSLFARREG